MVLSIWTLPLLLILGFLVWLWLALRRDKGVSAHERELITGYYWRRDEPIPSVMVAYMNGTWRMLGYTRREINAEFQRVSRLRWTKKPGVVPSEDDLGYRVEWSKSPSEPAEENLGHPADSGLFPAIRGFAPESEPPSSWQRTSIANDGAIIPPPYDVPTQEWINQLVEGDNSVYLHPN